MLTRFDAGIVIATGSKLGKEKAAELEPGGGCLATYRKLSRLIDGVFCPDFLDVSDKLISKVLRRGHGRVGLKNGVD